MRMVSSVLLRMLYFLCINYKVYVFYKMINYDMQFEKSFVEPLNVIIEKINWLVDRSYGTQGTLEDFFN